jgi:phosphoribulokinase
MKSQSVLLPLAVAAVSVYFLGQLSFLAPSAPSVPKQQLRAQQRGLVALQASANSVPTGLVWPSPEAEAKLREVDGITMYPTHAWTDDMSPIVPATAKLDAAPVIIGVAADSGCGKSTFLRRILGALGTEVTPGHTAVGDMMTVVCLDDYHTNDRAGRKATGFTALDAKENDFALMGAQIEALKQGKAVYKPIYNHDTGFKDPPELVEPNNVMVFEGLHPIYDEKARSQLDLGIYIDIVNEVKFAWKVARDVAERGWTEEQVQADIQKRLPDFSAFVDPQKANADVILRYEPSDKGLPFLKVKLIQKKGGAFPMIKLKKELTLTGSEPGATLKMYDDDWFGNDVTVVEMDGEIDMDNMEAQLKEIEANIEGLPTSSPTELTEAMIKLKASPGSQNGTGLLQSVIALKVKEVYDKLVGVPA